ncbi:AAA family ATPase [Actinoplanes sp. TBRC 11911]|uniref:NERD domain-containing protein n=1 Tax=Actinoplanes sp. TBRC 11911 TaxID=2729386 RepID=UPI00145F2044|nr:NERD domain-containing protein [Actinoplanes sp. TBRC 11911]NMO53849.1 AAA family ATPase [Actinoplanes sp. TBRC 11911]
MIPRELPSDLGTTAELRVHAALAALDVPGVGLHSLLLPEHDYKLTAEIDFLLILEAVVLVVEVKGARVARRYGVWTYSDRGGHYRESREGPFGQASSAMYALRGRLEDRLPPHLLADVPFGFVVITPDVDLPVSAEWADETYIGRGPFSRVNGLRDALRRAARYWTGKHHGAAPIRKDVREQLLSVLRPDFDRSPGLAVRASLLDASFDRLTAEQFARLDLIIDNPRVLCAGGAGTGKTFLAAEVTRRYRRVGEDVMIICRSPVLAAYLHGRLAGSGVQVVCYDDLPGFRGKVDYLVVDEAQDLMSFEQLDALDRVVDGGLEHGRWVMFLDPNGQAHVYDEYDDDALAMLRGTGAVLATLRHNCRNTPQIAFQTRALTGADIGVSVAGSGPEVEFCRCADPAEETALLEKHLRLLYEQEVPGQDITLLSLRGDWETSSARGLRDARRGRIRVLDADWAAGWPGNDLTWASVKDIKGLENRFICVIDADGLTGEHLDDLYVALSRARAGLWVAVDQAASGRVRDLFAEHSLAAVEAFGKAAR